MVTFSYVDFRPFSQAHPNIKVHWGCEAVTLSVNSLLMPVCAFQPISYLTSGVKETHIIHATVKHETRDVMSNYLLTRHFWVPSHQMKWGHASISFNHINFNRPHSGPWNPAFYISLHLHRLKGQHYFSHGRGCCDENGLSDGLDDKYFRIQGPIVDLNMEVNLTWISL